MPTLKSGAAQVRQKKSRVGVVPLDVPAQAIEEARWAIENGLNQSGYCVHTRMTVYTFNMYISLQYIAT